MNKSLVYTKTGDKGTTSLIGGTRIAKNHDKLEAYGTVDELNTHLGMIRSFDIDDRSNQFIIDIQNHLFTIGAYLATDSEKSDLRSRLNTEEKFIEALEMEMDSLESSLPELTQFLLPGGHPTVSSCHIARTVCRRAERRAITVSEDNHSDNYIVRYLNRLSDYLFVLSRFQAKRLNVSEIPWSK